MKREVIALLTPFMWCLYIILKFIFTKKIEQTKGDSMSGQLGDENIKKVLGGFDAAAGEIAKVAKDGIQVKDIETIVEDILSSPELRNQLTNIVSSFKPAIEEVKDLDVLEGIDVAKFEYEAIKLIIDQLKK